MASELPITRLARRFREFIVDGLCKAVAAHSAPNRHLSPLLMLLWSRLSRTVQRFDRLAAEIREGKGRLHAADPTTEPMTDPAGPAAAPVSDTQSPVACPRLPSKRPRPPALPRGIGWVYRMVPAATVHRADLEIWLDDPQMPALLAAEPRLGRLIRPLCRMLGVAFPDWLRLPPRPGTTARDASTGPARRPAARRASPAAAFPEGPSWLNPPRRRPEPIPSAVALRQTT